MLIENLNFKLFEEKYEEITQQQWARAFSDPTMFNAIPHFTSRKIYKVLNFTETQLFYSKFYKVVKELFA